MAIAQDDHASPRAVSGDFLTAEEFAGLAGIDGTLRQTRPAPEVEMKLRGLGLIARSIPSGLPIRTAKGDALIATGPAGSSGDAGRSGH